VKLGKKIQLGAKMFLEELESRILLSADRAAGLADQDDNQPNAEIDKVHESLN